MTTKPALEPTKTEPSDSKIETVAPTGFDDAGLTPHNTALLDGFEVFNPRRPIYDWEAAQHGIMRGLLKRIDEWNENGTTFWALVIEPKTPIFGQGGDIRETRPFLVPCRDPNTGEVVKTMVGHITVPLTEPPAELYSRMDPLYWAMIEVRRHPRGTGANPQWVFLVSRKRVQKRVG